MNGAQFIAGCILIGLGSIPIACTWIVLIIKSRSRSDGGISMVPPIFGLLVMVGLLLIEVPWHWAWIGFAIDPGVLLIRTRSREQALML